MNSITDKKPPIRILHLEDSPLDAELISERLAADGLDCNITRVEEKAAFEAALAAGSFDLIVADYNLPGYSGMDATQLAKKKLPDVPVIMISGTVGEDEAVKCLQLGATDYLLKQRLERLTPAVTRAIEEVNKQREMRKLEEQERQLKERHRMEMVTIVSNAQDGLVVIDCDGKIRFLNPAAERLFGRSRSELEGQLFGFPMNNDSQHPITIEIMDHDAGPRSAEMRVGNATWDEKDAVVASIRDVTERNQSEAKLRYLAQCDSLTDLANRNYLLDCLEQTMSGCNESKPQALLLMDLDHFKDINDSLGHHHGDLLLQQAAKRIKDTLPEVKVVARLGGDEFAVLLSDARILEAIQCARKILGAFQKPFVLQGISVMAKTSIGISLYPDHGQQPNLLLQRADVAMYIAKKRHSGYALYDAKKDFYSPRHLKLMSELQDGIAADQLVLFYQPKIDLRTNRVTGVEALVRWQHPTLGLLTPEKFLPLAERTGLMPALTTWVIRDALIQCCIWAGARIKIKTSVNLPTELVQDQDYLAQVPPMLKAMDVPADALMFEITESAIMADPQRAVQNLTRLRSLGFSFSIDDFGTGYSSLAYLKNFPVDELKIDRSFIQNMLSNDKDAAIVRSTIELSHNLGLKVVAEGVENRKILESLAALGCDGAQGYYISQPIPGIKITDWFRDSSWSLDSCSL